MKASLQIFRSRLPWILGLLILAAAAFLRLHALGEEFDRARGSNEASVASMVLVELNAVRTKLPERGRISLLLEGQDRIHELRPIIDTLSPLIAEYYRSGELPDLAVQAGLVVTEAEKLRPGFPGIAEGRLPNKDEIADLLEKFHVAEVDSATHTLAQYALVPLIIDPVLRPGLVLARLPKGKARAEALRLGLRWKKPVGKGWYLLEKRP